ncbi:carboxylesterase family domain-containing protein [Phthorimaea operculella]|nr:carboxylesterase family domain-containing protein [Phthorimaea operculella]
MALDNTVEVSEGLIQGEFVQNEFGGTYYSFKGIPFAEPPIGELRFKAPLPAKPWKGVKHATEFGPVCYQIDMFKKTGPLGSEDCLYLNVYTPEVKPITLLPVMVWIHGGGYHWGSGNDDLYGPEFLVRQGVILVTFNYRLGVLGFLSLDTVDAPGNAGMKDQVAALRWVKTNIKNFGGDPENITIFGESAGAGSVSLHLLSPMSKGLFKRAIIQSGSATAYWGQAFEIKEKAITIARKLGLNTEDDQKLYEFFKAQPKEVLIQTSVPITYAEKEEVNIEFGPTIEKDFGQERFLGDDSYKILQKGIHEEVDVMTGYVEDEGVLYLNSLEILDKEIERINNFLEALVPRNIRREIPIKKQLEVGRKMKKFYFDNKIVTRNDWRQIARHIGLNVFTYDMVQLQKNIAKLHKSFFYKFSCKSKRNFFKKIFTDDEVTKDVDVVCHCDDLPYLFPVKFMNQTVVKESREFQLIEKVTKLWTNFAKYGNPTPDNSLGVKWEPYTIQHQHYLDIGDELTLKTKPEYEDISFWEEVYRQYLPERIIH